MTELIKIEVSPDEYLFCEVDIDIEANAKYYICWEELFAAYSKDIVEDGIKRGYSDREIELVLEHYMFMIRNHTRWSTPC